ncbi:MAG: hypothetical protein ABIE74_00430 [Pseudomonadota bacterium]
MRRILSIIILSLFCCFTFQAFSAEKGSVTEFKDTLEKKDLDKSKRKVWHDDKDDPTGEVTEGLIDIFANFFLAGLVTNLDEGDFGYLYKELKREKRPALPTIRLDAGYQRVFDNTNVLYAKGEFGYLMLGADVKYNKYWQKNPKDVLDVFSSHFLLRSYLMEIFQINMALGAKYIKGTNSHTGFEIGFPFYLFFGKHIIWDILPYMAFMRGYHVYDLSSGINVKFGMVGARVGYKILSINDASLHGPEAGLFFQW